MLSGEFHFFIHDHLGNTRVVVNESGDVVESYDYYPFGMNLHRTLSQPIGTIDTFTGKELDEEGDLDWYYFGARYYDARIGRWMVVDPKAGEYSGLSPSVYGVNSPLNLVDPDGMEVVGDGTCDFQVRPQCLSCKTNSLVLFYCIFIKSWSVVPSAISPSTVKYEGTAPKGFVITS